MTQIWFCSQSQVYQNQKKKITDKSIDAKILNWIVAKILQLVIRRVGFISGMQGWFNIRKTIHIINHMNK